jgi:hypothetical protein
MTTKSFRMNPKTSAEFLPLKMLCAELGDQKTPIEASLTGFLPLIGGTRGTPRVRLSE